MAEGAEKSGDQGPKSGRTALPKLKWWQWALIALLALSLLSFFLPRTDSTMESPTTSTGSSNADSKNRAKVGHVRSLADVRAGPKDHVVSVRVLVDTLVVDAHLGEVISPHRFIDKAAGVMGELAKAIQAGPSDNITATTTSRVEFLTDGVTRLGEPVQLRLFVLSFDMSDLRQLRADNLSPAQLMNLATDTDTLSADGREALFDWCVTKGQSKDAPRFCSQAFSAD